MYIYTTIDRLQSLQTITSSKSSDLYATTNRCAQSTNKRWLKKYNWKRWPWSESVALISPQRPISCSIHFKRFDLIPLWIILVLQNIYISLLEILIKFTLKLISDFLFLIKFRDLLYKLKKNRGGHIFPNWEKVLTLKSEINSKRNREPFKKLANLIRHPKHVFLSSYEPGNTYWTYILLFFFFLYI